MTKWPFFKTRSTILLKQSLFRTQNFGDAQKDTVENVMSVQFSCNVECLEMHYPLIYQN